MDNEISGDGNQYDYGFRIYNPRIGRFLSVDPLSKSYPWYTPYQFAGNMPIAAIDIDGLEEYVVIHYKDQNNKTTKITVRAIFDNDDLKTPLNQHVHKVGTTEDIAKGNVLVFEVKKQKDGKEIMSIVENRNTAESKLTKQERNIFKKTKGSQELETGTTQSLAYGTDKPKKDLYQSVDFENKETIAYTSEFGIAPPPTKPKTPPAVVEKKEMVVKEVEIFVEGSPGDFQTEHAAKEMLPNMFKNNYESLKKLFGADSLVLIPKVHYNEPVKGGSGELRPTKTYTIPPKKS